jgi:hypothetical protein
MKASGWSFPAPWMLPIGHFIPIKGFLLASTAREKSY